VAVDSSGWPEMASDHWVRAASLPCEQVRAAGVGDGVSVTDGLDWGEVGPGDNGWGARGKERETGWWWGADMWARAARFKLDLK
jgi:hypothetical protein